MSKTPLFRKEMKIHLKIFLIPHVNNKILHIYQQLHGWVVRKGLAATVSEWLLPLFPLGIYDPL